MEKFIYRQGYNYPISPEDLKERLDKIEQRYGVIKPEFIIKEASSPEDILHSLFEWNNDKAANEFRLHQARRIIISVTVEKLPDISVFVNVKKQIENQDNDRFYVSIDKALNDKNYRSQIKSQCVEGIKHWKDKYRQYGFLEKQVDKAQLIIEEIEKVEI